MSGALAGGVNEAAVAKLMKTLGPNNPDLVQMASAALGYVTNKLAGEDALSTVLEGKVIITLDEVMEEEKSRIDSEQINKAIEELREGIYVVD